jgi:hypothetical protein
LIQEIIILDDKGIPLFHYDLSGNLDEDQNYELIASYFDQICRFAKYGFKESLTTLKMNKRVFYFYTDTKHHFHLIFQCDYKVDNKKFKKRTIDNFAVELFERFFTKYSQELLNFKGNVAPFKSFSKDIEELAHNKNILKEVELKPELF